MSKSKDYVEINIDFKKIFNIEKLDFEKFLPWIVVITALIINIVYFSVNTGVWWDEAEYLGFVNHLLSGNAYSMWEGRAIFYPLVLSIFGFINSSESFLRFGLLVISCLTGLFSFLVLKKLFNKEVGFVASMLFVTNGLFNFFSIRFLTGIPSLLFTLVGLFFFLKQPNLKNRLLTGSFIGFAIATRFTAIFIVPAMIIYDFLDKKKLIDYLWVPALFIGFVPSMIFDMTRGLSPLNTLSTFFVQSTAERDWGHNLGQWYYYLFNSPNIIGYLSIIFLIVGLVLVFSRLGNKKFQKELLLIGVYIVLHFISYSFMTELKETRYMLPILPFVFSIVGMGIISVSKLVSGFFKKNKKIISQVSSLIILLVISFYSLNLGNLMIFNSNTSYEELGFAGTLLNNYISPNDVIMTNAGPFVSYYTGKEVVGFPATMDDLYSEFDNNTNLNSIIISLYETTPSYLNDFVNNTRFSLLSAYTRNDYTIVIVLGYNR